MVEDAQSYLAEMRAEPVGAGDSNVRYAALRKAGNTEEEAGGAERERKRKREGQMKGGRTSRRGF